MEEQTEGGQSLFEQQEVGSWESLSPISTAVESFRQGLKVNKPRHP